MEVVQSRLAALLEHSGVGICLCAPFNEPLSQLSAARGEAPVRLRLALHIPELLREWEWRRATGVGSQSPGTDQFAKHSAETSAPRVVLSAETEAMMELSFYDRVRDPEVQTIGECCVCVRNRYQKETHSITRRYEVRSSRRQRSPYLVLKSRTPRQDKLRAGPVDVSR